MNSDTQAHDSDKTYRKLVLLDDLESFLEELEEQGIAEDGATASLPRDVYERMEGLGMSSITEIRDRIVELHRELDQED